MTSGPSVTALWRDALDDAERLERAEPDARDQALAALAQRDPARHARVLALLRESTGAQAEPHPVDDLFGAAVADAPVPPAEELAGTEIGPYRVIRRIGAGGMGEVWLAERTDGRYQGQVAIKLLAPGLHVALTERFRREGQILARVSHPNIARMLDAGATASGRLYLVLEFVDGVRIDDECDRRRLGIVPRLRIVLDACAAVSHAHANLVVHRDLKPSNILVTADGTVKLLDFGIAKLLQGDGDGAGETELTREAGRAMTLDYAAPEQVAGGTITTATDVYALGVLLYRLLSGGRPYRRTAGSAELARAIVEDEPRPLTAPPERSGDEAGDPAALRSTTPARLRQALRGDLETIVAKALKKDPLERYASVQALADDIARHLAHQPVLARPDAFGYRARKFLRRNRVQVAALGAVLATLVAGVAATAWQWQAATREAARTRSVVKVLTEVFTSVDPNRTGSARVPMIDLLERGWRQAQRDLARDPEMLGEVAHPLGLLMTAAGDSEATVEALEAAHRHLQRTGRRTTPEFLVVAMELANAWWTRGRRDDAMRTVDEVLVLAAAMGRPDAPEAIGAATLRGSIVRQDGRLDEARGLLEAAAASARRHLGDRHRNLQRALAELAEVARDQGRWLDARRLYQETQAATPPEERQALAATRLNAAVLEVDLGAYADAARLLEPLAAEMAELFGASSPYAVRAHSWHAIAQSHAGRFDAADAAINEALRAARDGPEADLVHYVQLTAARLQLRRGNLAQADALLAPALAHFEAGPADPQAAHRARVLRGEILLRSGSVEAGERLIGQAVEGERAFGADQDFRRLPALLRWAAAAELRRDGASARARYDEAVRIARLRLPEAHPERLRAELLLAQAVLRGEGGPAALGRLRSALAAWREVWTSRADLAAFSVYESRMLAATPTGAASSEDLFALLGF